MFSSAIFTSVLLNKHAYTYKPNFDSSKILDMEFWKFIKYEFCSSLNIREAFESYIKIEHNSENPKHWRDQVHWSKILSLCANNIYPALKGCVYMSQGIYSCVQLIPGVDRQGVLPLEMKGFLSKY